MMRDTKESMIRQADQDHALTARPPRMSQREREQAEEIAMLVRQGLIADCDIKAEYGLTDEQMRLVEEEC